MKSLCVTTLASIVLLAGASRGQEPAAAAAPAPSAVTNAPGTQKLTVEQIGKLQQERSELQKKLGEIITAIGQKRRQVVESDPELAGKKKRMDELDAEMRKLREELNTALGKVPDLKPQMEQMEATQRRLQEIDGQLRDVPGRPGRGLRPGGMPPIPPPPSRPPAPIVPPPGP